MEPQLEMVKRGFAAKTAIAITGVIAVAFCFAGCGRKDIEKGWISLGLGDYPMAIRFFQAGVEADPGRYDAHLGLGQSLLQKSFAEGDSAAFAYGLIQLEACRNLAPGNDISGILTDAYYERAKILLRGRDTLSALTNLSKAIERGPGNPKPLNLVGIVYGKLGEPDKAESLFRKALELDSTDASANFNLGMILWEAGEVRPAHGHWLKALKRLPHDEDVLDWFALSEKKLREAP
jgi:tetratricopeptide (TPR) repeat protein